MLIDNDPKLDFDDVLIRPKRSELGSRKDVDLIREYTFKHSQRKYKGVPILAANMDTIATVDMAKELLKYELGTALHKHYSVPELIDFFKWRSKYKKSVVFYSMGILEFDIAKLFEVDMSTKIDYLCVDVANGYSERFSSFIKQLRDAFPAIVIIAGNVVTGEMTEELILSGADIVKVGIGPGSVCTTRTQTGVGFPQLSAVIECADSAHGLGGHIIADGGCTCPGDLAKAFAAGADFVMLGGLFAGHDEGGGEVITKYFKTGEVSKTADGWEEVIEEQKFVQFYGMSSLAANEKHFGGLKKYRSSEGRDVLVPYRGKIELTIQNLLGGIRSTCTYAGAKKLKWLSKCTTFVKTGQQYNTVFAK